MGPLFPSAMMKFTWYCAFAAVLTVARVAADVPHDLSSLDQPFELDTASPTGEVKSLSKEELLTLVTKQNAANTVLTSTELTALGEEGTGFNVQNAVLTSTELTALGEEGTGFNVESERSFSVK